MGNFARVILWPRYLKIFLGGWIVRLQTLTEFQRIGQWMRMCGILPMTTPPPQQVSQKIQDENEMTALLAFAKSNPENFLIRTRLHVLRRLMTISPFEYQEWWSYQDTDERLRAAQFSARFFGGDPWL